MKTQEQLETWAAILGFTYDNLSASEFDYILKCSPFNLFYTDIGVGDPDEYIVHEPFHAHDMKTVLFFQ